jgi:hypothetical protein
MKEKGRDGIISVNQMHFMISRFYKKPSIRALIEEELGNSFNKTPTDAIEGALKFLRQWCEFHFPRFLGALDRIQKSIFEKHGYEAGDYTPFIAAVRHLFMHPAVTVLEEYGMPYSLTQKVLNAYDLGEEVDEILSNLPTVDPASLNLPDFEEEMLRDTIDNL